MPAPTTDPDGFCDSDKLIYGCYPGGACGYAVRYMLLLSPDADGLGDQRERNVRQDGAAHAMVDRCGLKRSSGWPWIHMNLNGMPEDIGLPETDPWWDLYPNIDLVNHTRSVINASFRFDDEPTSSHQSWGRWIWVDHVPPHAARMVFPNARILLLERDWKASFRDFSIKNIFQPAWDNPLQYVTQRHANCSIDAKLIEAGRDLSRPYYKQELRDVCGWSVAQFDMLGREEYIADAHVIDVERLLGADSWTDEYESLIEYCGLTPNHAAVGEFLEEYRGRQPTRGVWQPDAAWNWVKTGPNRQGRW